MFRLSSYAALAAVSFLPLACTGEASSTVTPAAPASRPSAAVAAVGALRSDDVAALWPSSGTKVFSTFDLLVGLPGASLDGRVAVLASGDAVAAGEPVAAGEGVWLLPPNQNHGELTLPVGKHDLCVQVLDGAGASKGPDWSAKVSYDVVANPAGGRKVWFIEPADGAMVGTKFRVKFGLEGMGLSPAGENPSDHTVGHHHVQINDGAPIPGTMVPADATHIHYGKAQTEGELELAPGVYELTMAFADAGHRAYGERMAATITVTVE